MLAQRINTALRPVPGWVVYPLALVPLALLVWHTLSGGLGVDPVKAIEHRLGEVALQLLVGGLAITPLRWLTGVSLIRYRRAIGLMSFLYVVLHLATWLLLDIQLRWTEIGADLLKRPYIMLGMLGFAVMIPLALTSNNAAIRRLGPAGWARLHKLTYVAALAGALHYMLLVKAWPLEPIAYFAAVIGLLAVRAIRNGWRTAARTA